MSFGEKDKIVTVRFNCFEQKRLEYVLKNHYPYCKVRFSELIKDLIEKRYLELMAREERK